MTEFKLGKKAATYDKRDLLFAKYRVDGVELPKLPKRFGHGKLIRKWGMLGNDRVGDCVLAGGAHETMLWNREAGIHVDFTDEGVLSDYSAITGYNPNDPNTDQGTDPRQAFDYRRSTGLVDAAGKRHTLGAYVALEPGNWDQLLEATYIFSGVGIGVEFPSSAMDQFNQGKPWSVVSGNVPIEGGHYIPAIGHASSSTVTIVTWGKAIHMTRGFYEKYCDEAYALLSPEYLKDGKSPEGFDLTALQADLAAL